MEVTGSDSDHDQRPWRHTTDEDSPLDRDDDPEWNTPAVINDLSLRTQAGTHDLLMGNHWVKFRSGESDEILLKVFSTSNYIFILVSSSSFFVHTKIVEPFPSGKICT